MKKHIVLITIAILVVIFSVSIYTYKSGSGFLDTSRPSSRTAGKFQWVKHWDELDLTAIKRDYQPYTVAEMREMWGEKLLAMYGGRERLKQAIGAADEVYPQDKYLARMLELGRPFFDFSDYKDALTDQRIWLFSTRIYWDTMSAAEKTAHLEQRGLSSDATWETYEEVLLKNDVVYSVNLWRAKKQDPFINSTLPSCF